MSILQEYEEINKILGLGRVNAIEDYIKYCKDEKNKDILYSDIVYKRKEYELFDKWFKEEIKPFKTTNLDTCYSVTLYQDYYWYDWEKDLKLGKDAKSGDGHNYEDIFKKYINDEMTNYSSLVKYDSESGMFCIYCKTEKDAELFAYSLSKLYKNEELMINKIKEMKVIYDKEEELFLNDEKFNI